MLTRRRPRLQPRAVQVDGESLTTFEGMSLLLNEHFTCIHREDIPQYIKVWALPSLCAQHH